MLKRLNLLVLLAFTACTSEGHEPRRRHATLSVVSGTIRWQVGDEVQERTISTDGGSDCTFSYDVTYSEVAAGIEEPFIQCEGEPSVSVSMAGVGDTRNLPPGVTTFALEPGESEYEPPFKWWPVYFGHLECELDATTYAATANVTMSEGEPRDYPELVSPDYRRRIELSLKTGPFASQPLDAECNAAVEVDVVVEQTADDFEDVPNGTR